MISPLPTLRETARAKINLTLRILGRRDDGYHALESLVAFADTGDTLSLDSEREFSLQVDGPFASSLDGSNLVAKASDEFLKAWPGARTGAFRLIKELPVASGIGGGSSDAAAALRLLRRANPGIEFEDRLEKIAARLGADVPVCLTGRTAFMGGIGEKIVFIDDLPALPAVLANPGVTVPTRDVFTALGAGPVAKDQPELPSLPENLTGIDAVADYVRGKGNGLAPAAVRIAPVIAEVLDGLESSPRCLAASLSGSGATCFALYRSRQDAVDAAGAISEIHPGWWVRAATLG